ncbi:hypothetical protein DL93DRAFT_562308 [Clavulina sp. PMI_390]|nr:hypothetical protein DL93DRAFT_562308 [Clavulina sp. PMI_390]
MRLSSIYTTLAIALAAGVTTVNAQGTSDVVCLDTFGWANNSLSQNPCLVGAYLEAPCNGGAFAINSIAEGYHYVGPTNDTSTQNACICSSVVYQLVSACGSCQNRTIISWDSWNFFCPTSMVSVGSYPEVIPSGTRVPHWAYLDPTQTDDFFNATLAQNTGDGPESSQAPGSTTSSSPTSTKANSITTGAGGTKTTSSPTTSNTSGGSKGGGGSNTGAIAGGVVGGIIGLGIVAGLAWFLLRRNPSGTPSARTGPPTNMGMGAPAGGSSAAYSGVPGSEPVTTGGAAMSEYQPTYPSTSPPPQAGFAPSMISGNQAGYYNPHDPSPYSHTPAPSSYAPAASPYPQQAFPGAGGAQHGYYPEQPRTGYSGMPEV